MEHNYKVKYYHVDRYNLHIAMIVEEKVSEKIDNLIYEALQNGTQ